MCIVPISPLEVPNRDDIPFDLLVLLSSEEYSEEELFQIAQFNSVEVNDNHVNYSEPEDWDAELEQEERERQERERLAAENQIKEGEEQAIVSEGRALFIEDFINFNSGLENVDEGIDSEEVEDWEFEIRVEEKNRLNLTK